MQLPGRRVFGPPHDRAAALAVLRRAVELGVDQIDTAQAELRAEGKLGGVALSNVTVDQVDAALDALAAVGGDRRDGA